MVCKIALSSIGATRAQILSFVDLDFLGMIRLINYIRTESNAGRGMPSLTTRADFEDDKYLTPVLKDDAILYSLHDIEGINFDDDPSDQPHSPIPMEHHRESEEGSRVADLEEKLLSVQRELEARKRELKAIRQRFGESVGNDLEGTGSQHEHVAKKLDIGPARSVIPLGNTDQSYFESYSGHGTYPSDV